MSLEESRFTPANDWCPNPQYWHSVDSEATEMEVSDFIGVLIRLIQPEYVVETGTYHGYTATVIGIALKDNGHGWLDTIENNTLAYETAKNYVEHLKLPVTLIHGNSMDFTPRQKIDFAFFDSWQEGRHLEFLRYKPWLPTGAIVAFHDTAPHHQVRKFIAGIDMNGMIDFIDFHTPRGLILGQVR